MKTVRFLKDKDFSNDGGVTATKAKTGDEIEVSDEKAERFVNAYLVEIVEAEAEAPADSDPDADQDEEQEPEGSKGDGEGSELDRAIQQLGESQKQLLEARDRVGEVETQLAAECEICGKTTYALEEKNAEYGTMAITLEGVEQELKEAREYITALEEEAATPDDPAAADDGSELADEKQDDGDEGWAGEGKATPEADEDEDVKTGAQ